MNTSIIKRYSRKPGFQDSLLQELPNKIVCGQVTSLHTEQYSGAAKFQFVRGSNENIVGR